MKSLCSSPTAAKCAEEVFRRAFCAAGLGRIRARSRAAAQGECTLLREAGFPIKDGKRVHARAANAISVEFLIDEPSFQPHHMLFHQKLGTLGIEANLRIVDAGAVSQTGG